MLEREETSALCSLATEFANVARLYRHAADHTDGSDGADLREESEIRQAAADRIVIDFAPGEMGATGSWLPSTEEVEFRLKALVHQGWARSSLADADQQLLARIRDLLIRGKPSARASGVIGRARDTLRARVEPPAVGQHGERVG